MKNRGDEYFKATTLVFALSIPLLLFALFVSLLHSSIPAISRYGLGFLFSVSWNPVTESYGALPFIYGTLVSSILALLIAGPLGLGCAIFLSESLPFPNFIKSVVSRMVELLAAIPSIVYGLWGIFVLGPVIGLNMLTASIILSIMILPTITVVSREVMDAVPNNLRESAIAMGATKWEMIKLAIIGPAKSGIIGAIILGLGRALGETMAVTMVIGNRPEISLSPFAPSYTLASVIANEFAEAVSEMSVSVLVELALILLIITMIVNAVARYLVWKTSNKAHI